MIDFFIQRWKITRLFVICLTLFTTTNIANATVPSSPSEAQTQNHKISPLSYPKYGEWRYNPQSSPPTLMWWNERMPMVPVLYISFLPDQIILNAVTPVWPDTGIVFYIKDKTDKLALNLTLQLKNKENCFYSATLYGQDRQDFLNELVTSHKARLITPSSYSQSLSLKHVYQATHVLLSNNPKLNLTLPPPKK